MRVKRSPGVDPWSAFQNNHIQSLAGEARRQRTTCRTRAYDADVKNNCVHIHELKDLER